MNKTIKNLIQEINCLYTWQDKYAFIIDIGRRLPFLSKYLKLDHNIVYGCANKVWVHCYAIKNKFYFQADGNGQIIKGILYIILLVSNGKTQKEICDINYQETFSQLDLLRNLTMNRSHGLLEVTERIKHVVQSWFL